MNFIVVHGAYGSPDDNWQPWLKKELEKLGHKVLLPRFPTPTGQTLENWMRILDEYDKLFDSNLIMVGHSIGSALILRKLEVISKPVRSVFVVAGFVESLNDSRFDKINKTFYEKDFDWNKIRKSASKFYVYHSDDDPYVPLEKGEFLARKLNTKLKIVKGAGHFNKAAGYTKFPLLLEDIKKEVGL